MSYIPTDGVSIERTNQTAIKVSVQGMSNRLTVDLLLWFAREAQKAVDAGMDPKTEVRIDNQRISARHVIVQEIP